MKFSEVGNIKKKMMETLEKAVDEMLNQVQYNEFSQARVAFDEKTKIWSEVNLKPTFFNAALVLEFPKYHGSNGEGFEVFCNPITELDKRGTWDTPTNYSIKFINEQNRKKRARKGK